MAVASLTRHIALMQRLEDRRTDLLESAAWLHDIGCPDAAHKYGNSKPAYQMEEEERLVGEWLDRTRTPAFGRRQDSNFPRKIVNDSRGS